MRSYLKYVQIHDADIVIRSSTVNEIWSSREAKATVLYISANTKITLPHRPKKYFKTEELFPDVPSGAVEPVWRTYER